MSDLKLEKALDAVCVAEKIGGVEGHREEAVPGAWEAQWVWEDTAR